MDAKVATLVFTGVVAVGTLIYYLFFDNKNEPHHYGKPKPPSNGQSSGNVPEFREPPETRPSRPRKKTIVVKKSNQETSSNTGISRRTVNTSTPCYSTARTNDIIRQTDNTIQSDKTVRASGALSDKSVDLISSSQPKLVSKINAETCSKSPKSDDKSAKIESKPSTSDDRSAETISKSLTANDNSAKRDSKYSTLNGKSAETISRSSTDNDNSAKTDSKPSTLNGKSAETISRPSTADDNSAKTYHNDKSAETTSKPPTSDDGYAEITTNDKSLNSTQSHSSGGFVNRSNSDLSDDPAASCSSTAQARSKSTVVIDRMLEKSSKKVHTHVDSANLNQQFCLACGESAIMFQPCQHKVFCRKHVIKYMEKAAVTFLEPLCPQSGCSQLINKFM